MPTLKTKKYKITWSMYEDEIVLEMLRVEPEHRGKGIATQVMNRWMNKFRGKRERISLHAFPQDFNKETFADDLVNLVKFYEKFGFEIQHGDENMGYEMAY